MKLVIFDVDGTLVDSQHMICAAMQQTFDAHGVECPPREQLLSIVGLSLPDAFMRLASGAPDFPVESFVAGYKDAFFALREADPQVEPLYPGARATLEALSAMPDVVLGIATGKSQRGARFVLGRHGLLDHFAVIKTADDAPSKPHPGMVVEAMRDTGVDARDTIMIGDSIYDMEMARAAGASPVGVAWGYHPVADLRTSGADFVASDFAELENALRTRLGKSA